MKDWVDFEVVKKMVPLEMALRHYQVPGLRRQRQHLVGRCPIHRGQRDDSFRASLGENIFHCFGCQAGGSVLDFVAALERCSIREAALRLQRWSGICAAWAAPAGGWRTKPCGEGEGGTVREKEGYNPPLGFVLRGVDCAHPYLRQRGIEGATAAQFGVGFYAGPGLMSGRIVIPIRNARGQLVAYAGRALEGRLPKYKLPAGFGKGLELYNLPRAMGTGQARVIVVEGYFDCLRVHQAGFGCVVGLMGSALAPVQEKVLVAQFAEVVLLLDGDGAGRAASQQMRSRLTPQCQVREVQVPDGTQPDQLSPAVLQQLLWPVTRSRGMGWTRGL